MKKSGKPSRPCFDAGSKYCPCYLALSGDCVACSLLRGEVTCDCGWSGICVYQEFLRNRGTSREGRTAMTSEIKEKMAIHETTTEGTTEVGTEVAAEATKPDGDVKNPARLPTGAGTPGRRAYILKLKVPPEMARWCIFPGSFILVRPTDTFERFNVPLSVMEALEDTVKVAMEIVGPKTKAIETALKGGITLTVTGPFWSGLQGLPLLRRFAGGTVLAVAKGMGQAGIVQVARYVVERGGRLRALLGPGSLGRIFIREDLINLGAEVEILPKERDHNMGRISREIQTGEYDLVVSGNSDAQHKALRFLLSEAFGAENPEHVEMTGEEAFSRDHSLHRKTVPAFAWLSNLTMTCGDGICGSCLVGGLRGCKACLTPEYALATF